MKCALGRTETNSNTEELRMNETQENTERKETKATASHAWEQRRPWSSFNRSIETSRRRGNERV